MKRKYWYFVSIRECPLCGHSEEIRERRYTKKPKDPWLRYTRTEIAWHCGY